MRDIDLVFAALGSALTRWSMVDRALTVLYAVTVNPRNPSIAAASIWKVTGHNLKVEMTDAAFDALFVEYPDTDASDVHEAWRKAKSAMAVASKGRNDLGHSALHSLVTMNGREPVLQKDRELFSALRAGEIDVRYFDVNECRRIESECFDAHHLLFKVLFPLDDFYRKNRIVMREDDAFPYDLSEMETQRAGRRRAARANRQKNSSQ